MSMTIEAANIYHADRANTAWADATEAARSAALIRAQDYITDTYDLPDDVQDDPRHDRAVYELALVALSESLVEIVTPQVVREKVDGVVEVQYSEGVIADRFPTISRILAPLLKPKVVTGFQSVKVCL
ncbi:hypothetical protein BRX37_14125 [Sphingomonas sp. S-NIH.Pt3_0716]|nr:hypothetical protein BRX37_14125 [Sphingomonas sp. S-NIH.Pt3_0716]